MLAANAIVCWDPMVATSVFIRSFTCSHTWHEVNRQLDETSCILFFINSLIFSSLAIEHLSPDVKKTLQSGIETVFPVALFVKAGVWVNCGNYLIGL
jgi:hypothetical protein